MLSVVRPLAGLVVVTSLLTAPSMLAQTTADTVLAARNGGATLLHLRPDAGFTAFGTVGTGSVPATGAGVRMMWYPGKYAFRAGRVDNIGDPHYSNGTTYWDDANVGAGSVAMGVNVRASGESSVALGASSAATGNRSFAFGGTATATGAVVIGSGAQATNDDALAMGPSSIAGGLASIVLGPSIANGNFAVAIGLQNSAGGTFSVAIGKNARMHTRSDWYTNYSGSIVLGDGCAQFSSDFVHPTANNQFVARGCGGIKMFTNMDLTSGAEMPAGASSWSSVSDRNRKHGFTDVDGEALLARLRQVPVTTWHYNAQGDSVRHMGAMAQDFYAAFGLGEDSLRISTIDMDGVTLRGVQALAVRTESLSGTAEVLSLELEATRSVVARQADELRALRSDLAALADRLARLEAAGATGAPALPPSTPAQFPR